MKSNSKEHNSSKFFEESHPPRFVQHLIDKFDLENEVSVSRGSLNVFRDLCLGHTLDEVRNDYFISSNETVKRRLSSVYAALGFPGSSSHKRTEKIIPFIKKEYKIYSQNIIKQANNNRLLRNLTPVLADQLTAEFEPTIISISSQLNEVNFKQIYQEMDKFAEKSIRRRCKSLEIEIYEIDFLRVKHDVIVATYAKLFCCSLKQWRSSNFRT